MPPIPGEHLIERSADTVLKKASPVAISIGVCCLFFAASAGIVIWLFGPIYLDAQRIAADAGHMKDAHEKCVRRLETLEAKVRDLESRKVASSH